MTFLTPATRAVVRRHDRPRRHVHSARPARSSPPSHRDQPLPGDAGPAAARPRTRAASSRWRSARSSQTRSRANRMSSFTGFCGSAALGAPACFRRHDDLAPPARRRARRGTSARAAASAAGGDVVRGTAPDDGGGARSSVRNHRVRRGLLQEFARSWLTALSRSAASVPASSPKKVSRRCQQPGRDGLDQRLSDALMRSA